MKLDRYRFDGKEKCNLKKLPTNSKQDKVKKEDIVAKTLKNHAEIELLQDRLYAEGKESLIIVLQAMDAAGKDSTVKHVMSGVNPQGIDVYSFKQPSSEESSRDFLWRVNKCIPARGKMALYNRSYYEDVLVVKVHQLQKGYKMPKRITDDGDFFKKRYKHIRNYEEYLYENSYRTLKIFLNVSKDTQKERFLERIDIPEKNWKFSASDLKERALWDDYHDAYEDAINETASKESPWYVIPADQKWYSRYLISEAILQALKDIDPHYPEMPKEQKELLAQNKETLLNEKGSKKPEKEEKTVKAEKTEKVEKPAKEAKVEKAGKPAKEAKAEKPAKEKKVKEEK